MERGIDIGLYTTAATLADKLRQRDESRRAEATWNMKRLPEGMGKGQTPDRLFFAYNGFWRGYFLIVPEVLFNPHDTEKPYSLIFDLNSWHEIASMPVAHFRGFRYLRDMPE